MSRRWRDWRFDKEHPFNTMPTLFKGTQPSDFDESGLLTQDPWPIGPGATMPDDHVSNWDIPEAAQFKTKGPDDSYITRTEWAWSWGSEATLHSMRVISRLPVIIVEIDNVALTFNLSNPGEITGLRRLAKVIHNALDGTI